MKQFNTCTKNDVIFEKKIRFCSCVLAVSYPYHAYI